MPVRSGWLSPTGQTRQNTRITNIGATTPVNPLGVRSGILPGTYDGKFRVGGLWLSGSGPMTATVYHGRAVVQGGNNDGAYPVAVDQDLTLTFGDGDPLNPRLDLVVLRVYDNDADALSKYEAAVEIVQGEAKATPVAPPAPERSLTLFTVRVPAGASAGNGGIPWTTTGTLTDLRTTTVSAGGILPVYNNAGVPGSYPGQYQDNDNSHFLQRWDGTDWIPYPKEIGGIAPSAAVSTGSYTGQFREANGVLQRWTGSAWANYQPPVEVTTTNTGTTAAPNWNVTNFQGRKTRGVCTLTLTVTRTGADLTATAAGNISPDELLCTLPTGWRPVYDFDSLGQDAYGCGAVTFQSNGSVHLRTWSGTGVLTAGRLVRITATFVQ
ncbi:hypothetical protein ABZX98_02285 [Streptomyces sp. NPDC002992]|uniref:hypothetical protein n=1 Tax=Streptomyces sp. NPDC002992 TaxID=3154273 RepID=UPI0033B04723